MSSAEELQDLYSVLQISQSANSEEIRKSYQRLVKEVWKPGRSISLHSLNKYIVYVFLFDYLPLWSCLPVHVSESKLFQSM